MPNLINQFKFKAIPCFLLLVAVSAVAQQKTYLDNNWIETTEENASYYRIIEQKEDSLFYIKDYYIHEVLQMDGHFLDQEAKMGHGLVNWYDAKGKITVSRNYRKGIPEGESIHYLSDGRVFGKGIYKNGNPYEGFFYDECACPAPYSTYNKGLKQSELRYYKNTIQIAKETTFSPLGNPKSEKVYDKQNKLVAHLNYSEKKGFIPESGTKVDFYEENAQVVAIKTKTLYQFGKKTGAEITYNQDGEEWLKGIYKEGKKHSGSFLEELIQREYVNGLQEGKQVNYDKDFNILAESEYKSGKPFAGIVLEYKKEKTYKDGIITEQKNYLDDQRKKLTSSFTYENEKYHVLWYDANGALLGSGYADMHMKPLQGLFIYLGKKTYFKDGKKEGLETEYDYQNQIIAKAQYKNNLLLWKKTRKPNSDDFYHCDYKDNKPFNGKLMHYLNEHHYKNGWLSKIVYYRHDEDQNPSKLIPLEIIEYEEGSPKTPSKTTIYKKGKEYVLRYQEGSPYQGTLIENSKLITYKKGDQTGPYERYLNNKTIEQGTYLKGEKHGQITYIPLDGSPATTCEFDEGKPMNGTISNYWEITSYKDGEKHGQNTRFFHGPSHRDAVEIINYKNGKKEGNYQFTTDSRTLPKTIKGVYKNDAPYHGDFYDPNTKITYSYINGVKHGTFVTKIFDMEIHKIYQNGKLQSEESFFINPMESISKGTYKDNHPYNGTFLFYNPESHIREGTITTYQNGQKHGRESYVTLIKDQKIELGFNTYKTGKKEGSYATYIKQDLPKGIDFIEGVYKNDLPYSGQFITTKNDDLELKVLSTFKKGKKEGLEIYQVKHKDTDSLYYQDGKIIHGVQVEFSEKEPYTNQLLFRHFYEKGQKIKTVIPTFKLNPYTVVYSPNGFDIKIKNETEAFFFFNTQLSFDNAKKTSGVIQYTHKGKSVGSLTFNNGRITSGKVEIKFPENNSFSSKSVIVKDGLLVSTFLLNPGYPLNYQVILPNKIPNVLTYKDFMMLATLFYEGVNEEQKKYKQFLTNESLTTEFRVKDGKLIGTKINAYEDENYNGHLFEIRHRKEGQKDEDVFEKRDLSYQELIEEIRKLKHKLY